MSCLLPLVNANRPRLFGTVDGNEQNPTAISANTIRLFTTIVTDFITQATHHAIICREMEKRLKEGLKVWKLTDGEEVRSGLFFPHASTNAH